MKKLFTILALVVSLCSHAQQKEIPLYSGAAPGSENWTWSEQKINANGNVMVVDVSKPTLTPFIPDKPNGTAIIVAPGGAFHILSIESEGNQVAKKLNEKGITVFVLKYRLVHSDPSKPENSLMTLMATRNFKKLDSINASVVKLALQDGLAAVKYVRDHAKEYKIDPNKIGFMGFSAGGTVTMSVVYSANDATRPNFVAPIYLYAKAVIGSTVPTVKTPIFIVAASDDELGLASHSVNVYSKWFEANQPAELHMYEKGGHGFGMNKKNLPTDSWIDRFTDWLGLHGY
ncbi:MAG: alpha/beta hydrolase [Cyclobacteriaceae bacterium]